MLALTFTLTSCESDVPGPQGPQGEQGPAGPQGPAGQDGEDGNANVTAYDIFISSGDWTQFGSYGDAGYGYAVTKSVPGITNDIMDDGAVLCYLYNSSWDVYTAFPFMGTEDGYTYNYIYGYRLGEIILNRLDSDLYTTPPTSDWTIKVVVIAGSNKKAPEIDLTNFAEVAAYYGLDY